MKTFVFTGDFAKLAGFVDRVKKAPEVLKSVNVQLAEETIELIVDDISRHRDPYGKPHPKPLLRDGNPLEETGALKSSWFRKAVSAASYTISNARVYAHWLQSGTGLYGPRKQRIRPKKARWNERERKALKLPGPMFRSSVAGIKPRRMVPDRGLPEDWRARLEETALETLDDYFS